jgi:hypothetical protein
VSRARDLVRKKTAHPKSRDGYVTRLEKVGVLVVEGNAVSLTEEWLESLNDEREQAGEIADMQRDMGRYHDERARERNRHPGRPAAGPTDEDLAANRQHFQDVLQAQKYLEFARKRGLAMEAMEAWESGANLNLQRLMDGEMQNVGYLVRSVFAYHRIPPQQWEFMAEEWRAPVLAAASLLAREYAHVGAA